ncbi:MAG: dienelactone hydrolase family protein [Gemmatimonadaceae bacterium]
MIEQHIDVVTKDGTVDAELARPDSTDRLPGVIVLTDIHGLRPAMTDFSKRIAEHGYLVLTPNIFYRTSKSPVFDFEADFRNERTQARFKELVGPLTPDAMARDASAYVDFLSAQPNVSRGPMGVVGFCFSGAFALRTAAARPDRIGAAASFHGARLFMDTPDSPHLVLPRVKARLYFGHAENDQSMRAELIEKLDRALDEWGGSYESEVYEGAKHGWMFPGKVYHPEQADRGFENLMELFDDALRSPVNA